MYKNRKGFEDENRTQWNGYHDGQYSGKVKERGRREAVRRV